ncbi:UNKNOWN [Stylonychia lemnae]|uniref:Uncharacterized protein n=1 Tax=Stylonychia lemnae TaxID=5949 RepID=A0A078A468_STYLE|nr:UNKNOWN [Stylonychia lemnae]|eukprot:CDW77058.1 UNKNOWN [Stylonychia lemnae]
MKLSNQQLQNLDQKKIHQTTLDEFQAEQQYKAGVTPNKLRMIPPMNFQKVNNTTSQDEDSDDARVPNEFQDFSAGRKERQNDALLIKIIEPDKRKQAKGLQCANELKTHSEQSRGYKEIANQKQQLIPFHTLQTTNEQVDKEVKDLRQLDFKQIMELSNAVLQKQQEIAVGSQTTKNKKKFSTKASNINLTLNEQGYSNLTIKQQAKLFRNEQRQSKENFVKDCKIQEIKKTPNLNATLSSLQNHGSFLMSQMNINDYQNDGNFSPKQGSLDFSRMMMSESTSKMRLSDSKEYERLFNQQSEQKRSANIESRQRNNSTDHSKSRNQVSQQNALKKQSKSHFTEQDQNQIRIPELRTMAPQNMEKLNSNQLSQINLIQCNNKNDQSLNLQLSANRREGFSEELERIDEVTSSNQKGNNDKLKKKIVEQQLKIYKQSKKQSQGRKSPFGNISKLQAQNSSTQITNYSRLYQQQAQWVKQRKEYQPPNFEEQELEHCTFKPEISKSPIRIKSSEREQQNSAARRSYQEFAKDQVHLEKLKEEKLRQLRENFINDQLIKIQNKKRQKQLKGNGSRERDQSNLSSMDFLQRSQAFEQKKEEHLSVLQEKYYGSSSRWASRSGSRELSKSRHNISTEEVVQRLYNHRRIQSTNNHDAQTTAIGENIALKFQEVSLNQKSLQYVSQRLHKDIDQALKDCKIKDDQISYNQFLKFMFSMGYKPRTYASEAVFEKQRKLETKLWDRITNNGDYKKVHILTLKIFFTAIEGVFFPWMIESSPPKDEDQKQKQDIVVFLQDQEEAALISKKYFVLLQNRRRHLDEESSKQRSKSRDNRLNQSYQNLSSNYFDKGQSSRGNLNITISMKQQKEHADSLIQRGRYQQEKLEYLQQLKQQQELDDCTFKPFTNRRNNFTIDNQLTIDDKFSQLHLKDHTRSRSKELKPADEIEYERAQTECSFAPQQYSSSKKLNSKQPSISGPLNFINQTSGQRNLEQQLVKENSENKKIVDSQKQKYTLFSPQRSENKHKPVLSPKILYKTDNNPNNLYYPQTKVKAQTNKNTKPMVTDSLNATLNKSRENLIRSKQNTQKSPSSSHSSLLQSQNKFKPVLQSSVIKDRSDMLNKDISPHLTKNDSNLRSNNFSPKQRVESPPHRDTLNSSIDRQITSVSPNSQGQSETQNKVSTQQQQQNQQLAYIPPPIPLLYLDVNLGDDKMQRIIINEGDNIQFIVDEFCSRYNLNRKKKAKLERAIDQQLAGHLHSIQEEDC